LGRVAVVAICLEARFCNKDATACSVWRRQRRANCQIQEMKLSRCVHRALFQRRGKRRGPKVHSFTWACHGSSRGPLRACQTRDRSGPDPAECGEDDRRRAAQTAHLSELIRNGHTAFKVHLSNGHALLRRGCTCQRSRHGTAEGTAQTLSARDVANLIVVRICRPLRSYLASLTTLRGWFSSFANWSIPCQ
jgi:hypothetical protein